MTSFKLLDQQSRRVFTTVALLVATIVPALSPVLVSAAQLTTRSITLSSASASKTGVTYEVQFTATNAATAVALNFCTNSPLINTTCAAPDATFDAKTSAAASGWTVDSTNSTANKLILTGGSISAGANTITVTGVVNPATTGTLYARIVTYGGGTAAADAGAYTAANADAGGHGHADDGGIAMSITNDIAVNAAVLESLTFCVSGASITVANCASGLTAPSLTLGETTGTVVALDTQHVSTGTVYTQLSTNAVGGAVVNIKSANVCGGLARASLSTCDIPATNTTTLAAGTAGIGVQIGDASGTTNSISGANGKLQPYTGGNYGTTAYALTFTGANTGVASTYGDPILDTNSTTANNMNNSLQFGASISNQTPAGKYSNSYSLIATGKF